MCFARYDAQEMAAALRATVLLFIARGREAAQKHAYAWPVRAEDYARMLLGLDYSPDDGV